MSESESFGTYIDVTGVDIVGMLIHVICSAQPHLIIHKRQNFSVAISRRKLNYSTLAELSVLLLVAVQPGEQSVLHIQIFLLGFFHEVLERDSLLQFFHFVVPANQEVREILARVRPLNY